MTEFSVNRELDYTVLRVHLKEAQEIDNASETIYSSISSIIKSWFPNLFDLECYQYVIRIENGGRVFETFVDKLKEIILETFTTEDLQIVEEANEMVRFQRDKTERQTFLTKEKKKILDRVRQRYNRIITKTYGPKCCSCVAKRDFTYRVKCKCTTTGICIVCLKNNLLSHSGYVECPNCYERLREFICTENKIHTLTSLFNFVEELEEDIQDDDDEELFCTNLLKKRKRLLSSTSASLPVSSTSAPLPVSSTSASLPVSSSLEEENRLLKQRVIVLELEVIRLNNLLFPHPNNN